MTPRDKAVAFVFSSSIPTGAERRFIAIAEAFEKRGQRAILLVEEMKASSLQEYFGRDIKQLRTYIFPWWVSFWRKGMTKMPKLHSLLCFPFFLRISGKVFWNRLIKQHDVGLVHMAMTPYMAQMISIPAVFEVTSPDWADRIIANPDIVPESFLLHAVSDGVYKRLFATLSYRKLRVAPMLFPQADLTNYPPPMMENKENRIVFAHRFIQRKNGIIFAKAVNRFLQNNSDWFVSIRGTGEQESIIRDILKLNIQNGNVSFGYISNLSEELSKSRIFVSIIEPDNYPSQSVVEAMVHGNALILSNCGQTKEKFFSNNGILVEPEENAILYGIEKLTNDISALDDMGLASHHYARQQFSQDKYLDHLGELYNDVGFLCGWMK